MGKGIFGNVPLKNISLKLAIGGEDYFLKTLMDINENDDPAPVNKDVLPTGESFATVGQPGIQDMAVDFNDNLAVDAIDRIMQAIDEAEIVQATWETEEKIILPQETGRTVACPVGKTTAATWVGSVPSNQHLGPGICAKVDRGSGIFIYLPFISRSSSDAVNLNNKSAAAIAAKPYDLVIGSVIRGPFSCRLPGGDAVQFNDGKAASTLVVQPLTRMPRKKLKYEK